MRKHISLSYSALNVASYRVALLSICCVLSFATTAQITVKARIDSAVMTIGDPNRLLVLVEGNSPVERIGWEALDTMKQVVITGSEQVEQRGSAKSYALPFSVYDSVGLLFPRLAVYFPGETLYTNDVALLVEFAQIDSTLNSYRGLREESAQLSDYLNWIIAAIVGLLLLVAGFVMYRLRNKVEAPPPPPVVVEPAHVIALRRLDVLRKRENVDDKAYYSELDQILRAYLEDRYEVHALEQTSGEVVNTLRTRGLPDASELSDLLSQVDLVKFAKAELPAETRFAAIDRVAAFVEATKVIPPPVDTTKPVA